MMALFAKGGRAAIIEEPEDAKDVLQTFQTCALDGIARMVMIIAARLIALHMVVFAYAVNAMQWTLE